MTDLSTYGRREIQDELALSDRIGIEDPSVSAQCPTVILPAVSVE